MPCTAKLNPQNAYEDRMKIINAWLVSLVAFQWQITACGNSPESARVCESMQWIIQSAGGNLSFPS